jgi:hypothetical protein
MDACSGAVTAQSAAFPVFEDVFKACLFAPILNSPRAATIRSAASFLQHPFGGTSDLVASSAVCLE